MAVTKFGSPIKVGEYDPTTDTLDNGVILYDATTNKFVKYENGALVDDVSATDLQNYYTKAEIDALTTSDIAEGSNLYFTTARARTAAVVNSTSGSETDQAPSVSSIKTYVNAQGFLKNIVEDTTPDLGGDLNVGTFKITTASNTVRIQSAQNTVVRTDGTNTIQDRYIAGITLAANQPAGTTIASLTFPVATINGVIISYRIVTSNTRARIGTIHLVTDGTSATLIDQFTDTAGTGITFNTTVSGGNMIVTYRNTVAFTATMVADVKQFLT